MAGRISRLLVLCGIVTALAFVIYANTGAISNGEDGAINNEVAAIEGKSVKIEDVVSMANSHGYKLKGEDIQTLEGDFEHLMSEGYAEFITDAEMIDGKYRFRLDYGEDGEELIEYITVNRLDDGTIEWFCTSGENRNHVVMKDSGELYVDGQLID